MIHYDTIEDANILSIMLDLKYGYWVNQESKHFNSKHFVSRGFACIRTLSESSKNTLAAKKLYQNC